MAFAKLAEPRGTRGKHCKHLQSQQVLELGLRQRGDDADDPVDGAVQQRGQARGLAVRQLHDQRAVAEAVHELAQVVLAHNLRQRPQLQGLKLLKPGVEAKTEGLENRPGNTCLEAASAAPGRQYSPPIPRQVTW